MYILQLQGEVHLNNDAAVCNNVVCFYEKRYKIYDSNT